MLLQSQRPRKDKSHFYFVNFFQGAKMIMAMFTVDYFRF